MNWIAITIALIGDIMFGVIVDQLVWKPLSREFAKAKQPIAGDAK